MNSSIGLLPVVILVLGFEITDNTLVYGDQDPDDQTTGIEFAEKKELPAVTFDMTGGFRGRAEALKNGKPRLQIWPSGKVVCGSTSARMKDVESKLDAKELNDLLEFIVNQQKYYELTDEGIKKSIADAGKKIYIADAPTTNFVVNLKRGEHKLSVYAIMFVARQLPKLDEIKRVSAIREKLEQVVASANIGGQAKARSILKFINQRLKREYPDAQPMTYSDLRSAQQLTDETLVASFENEISNEKDGSTSRLTARYSKDENGQENVKFYLFKNRK